MPLKYRLIVTDVINLTLDKRHIFILVLLLAKCMNRADFF